MFFFNSNIVYSFTDAEIYFIKALNHVRQAHSSDARQAKHYQQKLIMSPHWESLLNNLGHTSRKLGKYDEALKYHTQVR